MSTVELLTPRRSFLRGAAVTTAAAVVGGAVASVSASAATSPGLGPDMAVAVAAFDRAEAAWNAAQSDAALADADRALCAAVDAVADELPQSAADLRAKADVLRRVRAVEGDPYSAGHDWLLETLLSDIQAAGAA